MKQTHDLSQLEWKLSGWVPYTWLMQPGRNLSDSPAADIRSVPSMIPCSVQYALREAGVIPDWNLGIESRKCEWAENRHWVYETHIPDEWVRQGAKVTLKCQGLDYLGTIVLNEKAVGEFVGTHIPHSFDLTEHLTETDNELRIAFGDAPRWLGQFGKTSEMKEWKTRFNYFWDWTARLMQIGIWDAVCLEVTSGPAIERFQCTTTTDAAGSRGSVQATGSVGEGADRIRLSLTNDGAKVAEVTVPAAEFNASGAVITDVPVKLWWPNLLGDQPLYEAKLELLDGESKVVDTASRSIGFREITWEQCEGAPANADPWICCVNGKRVFLQGANWVPVRPNFADVTFEDYRKRLELYKDLGTNILRVWGGAILERRCFYDLCDRLGIMVWQEFPLSSSSIDCWPPEDQVCVDAIGRIAVSYIERRQNHPSLIIWCGGNELISNEAYVPADEKHPMIARMGETCRKLDPGRRFLPTSASGPREHASEADWGKGLHWDVHGPWKAGGDLDDGWARYWAADDALFRSETGNPGASPAEIIRRTAGECDVLPVHRTNPLWRRNLDWWVENDEFAREMGRQPETLEEYVEWSQARQAKALGIAMRSAKGRFPRCGGMMLWMGHDCYPCCANTAIIDFDGNPKPAALELKRIWRGED